MRIRYRISAAESGTRPHSNRNPSNPITVLKITARHGQACRAMRVDKMTTAHPITVIAMPTALNRDMSPILLLRSSAYSTLLLTNLRAITSITASATQQDRKPKHKYFKSAPEPESPASAFRVDLASYPTTFSGLLGRWDSPKSRFPEAPTPQAERTIPRP
jgi:hypothetical protein